MTVTWTQVRLKCGCGREWSHDCDQNWVNRRSAEGEASVFTDTNPEPFVVQAILGLPARLKAHRAARNLSLREVGRDTGLSFSTLCRIEQGKDYTVDSLLAVATYLDGAR